MKKVVTIIIVIAIALVAGFLIFYQNNSPEQNWTSRTDDQAAVTVTVTPLDIFTRSKEWKFNVAMNTHSVELNQDMTKVAVLVDDRGKEYQAISWQGAEGGGHHREGILIFNAITPPPKYVELQIKDVGASTIRLFKWEINK